MSDNPVVVTVRYQALSGQDERTRIALEALIATVLATEPDCFGIQLHVDADDTSRLLLYESWRSRASYSGPHLQTPHLGAFVVAARELLAGPPTIEFWNRLDDRVQKP